MWYSGDGNWLYVWDTHDCVWFFLCLPYPDLYRVKGVYFSMMWSWSCLVYVWALTLRVAECEYKCRIFKWLPHIDALWRHRSGSNSDEVMAYSLMSLNYYLKQCWLIINGFLWHSGVRSQESFIYNNRKHRIKQWRRYNNSRGNSTI